MDDVFMTCSGEQVFKAIQFPTKPRAAVSNYNPAWLNNNNKKTVMLKKKKSKLRVNLKAS